MLRTLALPLALLAPPQGAPVPSETNAVAPPASEQEMTSVLVFSEIGANDFRISNVGADGDATADAGWPAVAYDPVLNRFLAVWAADDVNYGTVDDEWEISGQFLDASDGSEIGKDFRISQMGPDKDPTYDAILADVAHDPVLNRYLVVWRGDDDSVGPDELEVWGQLIDGATGAEIGADFRISDAGPNGDTTFEASYPAVAFNPTTQEFLVVWEANEGEPGKADKEIFGQLISSATGAEVGPNDFQISEMGGLGDIDYQAEEPAVVYCPERDEFLVVWEGSDDRIGLALDEIEIFGQRLDHNGKQVGPDDFRISDMGPDGDDYFRAYGPAVAWSDLADHYLVAWPGYDVVPGVNDIEIFCQLLDADGSEVGPNDLLISEMGLPGVYLHLAFAPSVAFVRSSNEFVVVWYGDESYGTYTDREIFGQAIDAVSGYQRGEDDFRLSDMGPDGNSLYTAHHPDVAYNPRDGHYLTVWNGSDDSGGLSPYEREVFGQLANSSVGVRYCTAGTSASGCQARIEATGTPSASTPKGFYLHATDVEGSKSALFFFGVNGRQANPWGKGSSYQCVVPPVKRAGLLVPNGTTGECDGWFTQDLNSRWAARPLQNPGAGAVVQAQLWYRDPLNTSNQTTSLSDAIEFTVGP